MEAYSITQTDCVILPSFTVFANEFYVYPRVNAS